MWLHVKWRCRFLSCKGRCEASSSGWDVSAGRQAHRCQRPSQQSLKRKSQRIRSRRPTQPRQRSQTPKDPHPKRRTLEKRCPSSRSNRRLQQILMFSTSRRLATLKLRQQSHRQHPEVVSAVVVPLQPVRFCSCCDFERLQVVFPKRLGDWKLQEKNRTTSSCRRCLQRGCLRCAVAPVNWNFHQKFPESETWLGRAL